MLTHHKLCTWVSDNRWFTFWETWRCCGVVDNFILASARSSVEDFTRALVIIHCPHVSTPLWARGRGFGGVIGLPALQAICPSKSCVGGEGHERLVYPYGWSVGCDATWCNTPVPSSCHSLWALKPLKGLVLTWRWVVTLLRLFMAWDETTTS